MTSNNIGIIGYGAVVGQLTRGLKRTSHETRSCRKDPRIMRETIAWADTLILCVPFTAIDELLKLAGDTFAGKTLVDVTNAIDHEMKLAVGFTTSGAENLQRRLPNTRVVKAFNTVFAEHMDTGRLGNQSLSAFVASDDTAAKLMVLELARKIGFDAVDAGPLQSARLLEPLGLLNIQLGYVQKMGTGIGFRLMHTA